MVIAILAGAFVVAALGLLIASELARTLIARLTGLELGRWMRLMRLPGRTGSKSTRLLAIASGPLGAYLAISLLAFGLFRCRGIADPVTATRVATTADGFAAAGKLVEGDRILAVDGIAFEGGSRELSRLVQLTAGRAVVLEIERDGARQNVPIDPMRADDGAWRLGVTLDPMVRDNALSARTAIAYPARQAAAIIGGIVEILTGHEEADIGGPVRIVAEFRAPPMSIATQLLDVVLLLAVYLWLALVAFDVVRAIVLLVRR